MKRFLARSLALVGTVVFSATLLAQASPQRLRGTIRSFDGTTLVVVDRGGEVKTLSLAPDFAVNEVVAIEPSAIKPGSFVGTAAMPAADGSLKAIEVLVFPEAARGSSEGHFDWDLQPGSTMTNATVAKLASTPQGRSLTLHYPNGEKTVVVPDNVPIVTFKPGDKALLVPGAKVVVFAQTNDGKSTAMRVLAGRDGFAPPM